MKLKFLLICISLIIQTTICVSVAQNVDPSSVNVEKLTDDQIMKLISEMEKKGLSENEAIGLARAKGMSNAQISLLQKRIQEVKLSGGVESYKAKNISETETETIDDKLSTKALIESSEVNTNIFGFSFFNNANLTFEPSVNIPVSKSYVLGAGDELLIDVWGASQQSYQLVINTNGEVNIPLVGPVFLAGQTLDYAENRLKSALSSIYSDLKSSSPRTFASVRVGQIKSIKVNVLGEVFAPGTYTVPGTATLFNILYLSGGPNKNGSFRDIQLIRGGKIISHLDVYDFLINGNANVNQSVMDGDIVMVPTYIKRVRVAGEFKRKGIFEAIGDESVGKLISYAGGLTENAYKSSIKLYRNNGRERTFKEITEENINEVILSNGDSIYVGKILDRYNNKVSIEGAVFSPGDFEYTEGLSLKQLIEKADGLIENAFLNRGLITRLKDDYTPENISFSVEDVIKGESDIQLKKNDVIKISSIDNLREERTVAIWGEVQRMGVYPYADNLTLQDMVFKAGGFKESASESTIEVRRRLPYDVADKTTDVTSELFYFKVSRDLKLDDEGSNFILKPYDAIAVRFMPGSQSAGSVTILGNIMYGGIYNLTSDNERISDVINRAGGLASNAYPEGTKLVRKVKLTGEEKAKRDELMEKDSTIVFSELNFENVSVDLKSIIENPGSKDDIFMRDGDELRIPSQMQTVKISGEVLNPSSTVFEKNKNVRQYINSSGGFALNAKKSKTYVLRPNGASYATKGFLFFRSFPKVTPGSEIIIPKRPERQGMSPQAWIGITTSIASLSLIIVNVLNNLPKNDTTGK